MGNWINGILNIEGSSNKKIGLMRLFLLEIIKINGIMVKILLAVVIVSMMAIEYS